MTPVVLRGTNPNLKHFAHIRIAPMFAAPVVIATAYPGGVSVRCELPIFDRTDGGRWNVGTEQQMADEAFDKHGKQVAEEMVRRCIKQALAHEVDECLRDPNGGWLGGDPHQAIACDDPPPHGFELRMLEPPSAMRMLESVRIAAAPRKKRR